MFILHLRQTVVRARAAEGDAVDHRDEDVRAAAGVLPLGEGSALGEQLDGVEVVEVEGEGAHQQQGDRDQQQRGDDLRRGLEAGGAVDLGGLLDVGGDSILELKIQVNTMM